MKYINQDSIEIKPIECAGHDYYQIGIDKWNIVVGLGGLVKIANEANRIIQEYVDRFDKED
nr:MAG TPA: hypothetical protein [Caudoviricetes sp.]